MLRKAGSRGSARRLLSSSAVVSNKPKWSHTLHLPKTAFGPKIPTGDARAQLIADLLDAVYAWQHQQQRNDKFILHDGPPYANGDLHLGHALNKILKDIINRFEMLAHDKQVHYRPGWDCHGLPIEMKALERHIAAKRDPKTLSAAEIRATCRELALEMIDKQRAQFREFAIMTEFDSPYITMTHDYEVAQLRVFRKLMENGLLSRQLKPVWWGCETTTALAEAELEYNDKHTSVAVFVKFPVVSDLAAVIDPNHRLPGLALGLRLLIWTSTPWTIPANRAICVHRDLAYGLLRSRSGEYLVVAQALAEDVVALSNGEYEVVPDVSIAGHLLEGHRYRNPGLANAETHPVVHGDHVLASAGLGLVHTAPAHGGEDYLIGKSHGLEIALAVNSDGCYISANIPEGYRHLAGAKVTHAKTVKACLAHMDHHQMVYHVNPKFVHSYPYDWRLKTPVIQRATPQWFVNVERIKLVALEALDNTAFVPANGKNRLQLFVQNRNEWCILRQRTWGVPLPLVYHRATDEPVTDLAVVDHIIARIAEYGTDAWFEDEPDIGRWLPAGYDGTAFKKGRDTMDVWFDSGTSWTTLDPLGTGQFAADKPVADVYLEGSDQHRGWFQSSLLNKIVASGTNGSGFKPVAPFAKIITHGFTLDAKGQKMSKLKGNVILPRHAMEGGGKPWLPALGTDGLRLWAALSAYTLDVAVSAEILLRVFENVKKLRVTFKYLLGNLHGFEQPVEYAELAPLDQYVLLRLAALQTACLDNYRDHSYQKVVADINTHMNTDLSATYFDISKDTLYTAAANSQRRRAVQTVLAEVLRTYIGILAPIQPVLTQEVWAEYQKVFGYPEALPFMKPWLFYQLPAHYANPEVEAEFRDLWTLRDHVYRTMEGARVDGKFKNKLELALHFKQPLPVLERHQEWLDDYFLVSQALVDPVPADAEVVASSDVVDIVRSPHSKCPRCWKYTAPAPETLCGKCDAVVN